MENNLTLLIGVSGSGKTKYFKKLYEDYNIFHADNIKDLRSQIQSIYSPLIETKPTLINTWFDLNIADIIDLKNYFVYIEIHYMETPELKIVKNGNNKRYWGVYNENKLKMYNNKSVIYFPPPKRNKKKELKLMELFGTRYNWIKSQFPDIIE